MALWSNNGPGLAFIVALIVCIKFMKTKQKKKMFSVSISGTKQLDN